MRIEQAALAALQTRMLSLMKGPDEVPSPVFKANSPALAPATTAASPSGVAVPTASLATLVAASMAPLSRAATLRRAERGLAALERLHRLVRGGASPDHALDELAGWQGEGGGGEGAAGVLLEEVELRILVELAKKGR